MVNGDANNEGEVNMLSERAMRAQLALDFYKGSFVNADSDAQSDEEWLIDLMADIIHLASERGLDADSSIVRATNHFRSETSLAA